MTQTIEDPRLISLPFRDAEVVDLFAGPGGWDVNLRGEGIPSVGIEWDKAACLTREANGLPTIRGDVRSFGPANFPRARGLIASPPCQTFSMAGNGAGRRALDEVLEALNGMAAGVPVNFDGLDERTALVLDPLRWILEALEREDQGTGNPFQWVALEQVPTVLPVWEAYAEVLRAAGYSVVTGKMHAEQYGVPQTRTRAVLIAVLGHGGEEINFPAATHSRYYPRDPQRLDEGVLPWVSMAEALGLGMTHRPSMTVTGGGTDTGGAEVFGNGARKGMTRELEAGRWKFVANDKLANASHRDIDAPAPTITGGHDSNNRRWVPIEEGEAGVDYEFHNGNQANSAVRQVDKPAPTIHFGARQKMVEWVPIAANEGTTEDDMAWTGNRPSPTIVGSFAPDVVAAPGYRKAGDGPRQNAKGSVRVTPEEAAALQTFPDDYVWMGSRSKVYQQIGNAIPPRLAGAVLAHIDNLIALPDSIETLPALKEA